MSGITVFTLILEGIRVYLYIRYCRTCIGEYKMSKRILYLSFLPIWLLESFIVCLFPNGRQSDAFLCDASFLVLEIPYLLVMSLFYRGKVVRHLTALLLPVVYWVGKWCIIFAVFSEMAIGSFHYLIATVIAVSLFFILWILLERTGKSRREREREWLEQEIRMYENQFGLIRQSQENIRSLKHDMKHHIKMLTDMVAGEEKKDALHYLASMGAFMENREEYVDSGNEKIDSILNYMIARAIHAGIAVDWKVQIPEGLEISTFDINVILSNLFENALNALSHTEYPTLHVQMKYDRGILCISTRNNCSGENAVSRASEEHGFGLKNIRRIAQKYHGSLEITHRSNEFCADVLLFL